ncbi:hypothetical protein D3C81_1655620 [compost metagenome]
MEVSCEFTQGDTSIFGYIAPIFTVFVCLRTLTNHRSVAVTANGHRLEACSTSHGTDVQAIQAVCKRRSVNFIGVVVHIDVTRLTAEVQIPNSTSSDDNIFVTAFWHDFATASFLTVTKTVLTHC